MTMPKPTHYPLRRDRLIQSRAKKNQKNLCIIVAVNMSKQLSTVAATCPPCTSHWKGQLIFIKDFKNRDFLFCLVFFFKQLMKKNANNVNATPQF